MWIKDENKLIVLSGPTASGKTTLLRKAQEELGIKEVVSVTTRKPRDGEKHGKDYYFITEETFDDLSKSGQLAEEVEYAGNRYGVRKSDLFDSVNKGLSVIIVDTEGFKSLHNIDGLRDKLVPIFIDAPEESELLRRINKRGKIDGKELKKRLELVKRETKNADLYRNRIPAVPYISERVNKALVYFKFLEILKKEKIL